MNDFPSTSSLDDERNARLVEIFERQINIEIGQRMEILSHINTNIKLCQQTLDRLRKEATTKFYMDSYKDHDTDQPSIHPAVQKLIGKRPASNIEYERFLKSNVWRWKREMRKKHHRTHNSKPNVEESECSSKASDNELTEETSVKPCYIPPNIPGNPQENSTLRGNARKMHMRVMVGNLAKQLDSTSEDSATHKWMVYIRSVPGSLSVEKQVSKVRFFLHPSYKPHDIVTVPTPPFTLHRRGWGEFPMKVQLYFRNQMNKSMDIIHILKLSGTKSGYHTRSAETFSDLWIYPYEKDTSNSSNNGSQQILSLASNVLKECVPDFTPEARCHRCLNTSCVCKTKDDESLGDCGITTGQYHSDDSESSVSEDSQSDVEFLGSIKIDPYAEYGLGQQETYTLSSPEPLTSLNPSIGGSDDEKDSQTSIELDRSLAAKEEDNNCLTAGDKKVNEKLKSEGELDNFSTELTELCESNFISDKSDFDFINDLANCFEDLISEDDQMNFSSHYFEPESDFLNKKQECLIDSIEGENKSLTKEKKDTTKLVLQPNEVKQEPVVKQEFVDVGYEQCDEIVNKNIKSEKIELTENGMKNDGIIEIANDICANEDVVSTYFVNNKRTHDLDMEASSPVLEDPPNSKRKRLDEPTDQVQFQVPELDYYVEEVIVDTPEDISNRTDVDPSEKSKDIIVLLEHSYALSDFGFEGALTTTESKHPIEEGQKFSGIQDSVDSPIGTVNSLVHGQDIPATKNITRPLFFENVDSECKINEAFIESEKRSLESTSSPSGKTETFPINNSPIMKKGPHLLIQNQTNCKINQSLAKSDLMQHDGSLSKKPRPIKSPQSLLLKNIKPEKNQICETQTNNELSKSLLKPSLLKGHKIVNISYSKNSLLKPSLKNTQIPIYTSLNCQESLLKPQIKITKPQENRTLNQYIDVKDIKTKSVQQKNNIQNGVLLRDNIVINPSNRVTNRLQVGQSGILSSIQSKLGPIQNNAKNSVYYAKTKSGLLSNQTTSRSTNIITTTIKSEPLKNLNEKSETTVSTLNFSCTEKLNSSEVNKKILITGPQISVEPPYQRPVSSRTSVETSHRKLGSSQSHQVKQDCQKAYIDNLPKSSQKTAKKFASLNDIKTFIYFPKLANGLTSGISSPNNNIFKVNESILSSNSLHSELNDNIPNELLYDKAVFNPLDRNVKATAVNLQAEYYLEQVRLLMNTCRFVDVELAVRWLVRGLPLVHSDAKLTSFRMVHPYCAPTPEVFSSWSSPKQAACEWLRAKTVSRLLRGLQDKGSPLKDVWSTKTILQWTRFHGYSPTYVFDGSDKSSSDIDEKLLQKLQNKSSPAQVIEWMKSISCKETKEAVFEEEEEEEEIDIVNITSLCCKVVRASEVADPGLPVCFGKPWVREAHIFVRQQVHRVRAELGLESLVPGMPQVPAAATLLSHLLMIFTEDLLRRSLAAANRRGKEQIEIKDVCLAVLQREEFDFLSNTLVNNIVKNKSSST